VKKLHAWRISLTAPLLNESEWIAFLAFGETSEAFEAVTKEQGNANEYPARLISPEDGELHWYVDEALSE
jgi:6-phosphogluconolactonase